MYTKAQWQAFYDDYNIQGLAPGIIAIKMLEWYSGARIGEAAAFKKIATVTTAFFHTVVANAANYVAHTAAHATANIRRHTGARPSNGDVIAEFISQLDAPNINKEIAHPNTVAKLAVANIIRLVVMAITAAHRNLNSEGDLNLLLNVICDANNIELAAITEQAKQWAENYDVSEEINDDVIFDRNARKLEIIYHKQTPGLTALAALMDYQKAGHEHAAVILVRFTELTEYDLRNASNPEFAPDFLKPKQILLDLFERLFSQNKNFTLNNDLLVVATVIADKNQLDLNKILQQARQDSRIHSVFHNQPNNA